MTPEQILRLMFLEQRVTVLEDAVLDAMIKFAELDQPDMAAQMKAVFSAGKS